MRDDKDLSQEFLAQLCEIDVRQLRLIKRAETNFTISILKKIQVNLIYHFIKILDFTG
ncbi:XRE family transcriptional regulator [Sphingobacterium anhuiense]|uniref:XRE family transcriptional regulator n=1 Tax=Sphingobacterium anhuiense TaxID=493780 RepID=A0ABW5YVN5_9SPHI